MEDLQRIAELRQQLNEWSYQYYVLDDPTVPDYDYDMALRELEQLEAKHPETITPDSPTQRVGGEALTSFAPVHHPVPLESLQDVFSDEEMLEFVSRISAGATDPVSLWSPRWTACPSLWSMNMASLSGALPGETARPGRM